MVALNLHSTVVRHQDVLVALATLSVLVDTKDSAAKSAPLVTPASHRNGFVALLLPGLASQSASFLWRFCAFCCSVPATFSPTKVSLVKILIIHCQMLSILPAFAFT
jgi:hypothetical protein